MTRTKPAISRDTAFFWDGVTAHTLMLQRCTQCQSVQHPLLPNCSHCHSFDLEHIESTGRGTIYSYTVHHHPPLPDFVGPVPIVAVDLEEGVRFIANVVGDAAGIHIGAQVVVEFEDQDDGWAVPIFRIVDNGALRGPI